MNKKFKQKSTFLFRPFIAIITMIFSLMPFKVKAVDVSINVEHLGTLSTSYSMFNASGPCNIFSTSNPPYAQNGGGGPCTVSALMVPAQTSFNNQYILGISTYVYNLVDNNIIYAYENQVPRLTYLYNSGQDRQAQYVGVTSNQISTSSTIITHYFRLSGTGSTLGTLIYVPNVGIKTSEFMMISSAIEVLAAIPVNSGGQISDQGIINAIRQSETTNQQWLQTINTNLQNLMQNMNNNQGTINNINNNIQNSIDQTQQASDEGTANANTSQTDNESASQNIIGLMSDVVQVFYTPAGNCNIDVDLGNLDLGNLNFCSGKPREFEQIINLAGSILIVYACYRVARTIFRIWLTLSIFGQGGNTKGDK